MSDTPETPETAETTPTTEEKPAGPVSVRPTSVLTRPTDAPLRPGFRNPPNAKSKAQKKAKRK